MSNNLPLNDLELADALSRIPNELKDINVGFEKISFLVFTNIDDAFERKITEEIVAISLRKYFDNNN